MATYTTNINLKKPAQSDKIRIADFNGNADNIDAAFGADFGQSSKPSVNAAINNLADGLAIVAQGNVHAAISAGQFVYVRGHGTLGEGLYVANQAISANGTLSSSNLDADTSGGLNALNSKLTAYNGDTCTAGAKFTIDARVQRAGPLIFVSVVATATSNYGGSDVIAVVPSNLRPTRDTPAMTVTLYRGSAVYNYTNSGTVKTNGEIYENYTGSNGASGDIAVLNFVYSKE